MEDKGRDIGAPGECVTHLTSYYKRAEIEFLHFTPLRESLISYFVRVRALFWTKKGCRVDTFINIWVAFTKS